MRDAMVADGAIRVSCAGLGAMILEEFDHGVAELEHHSAGGRAWKADDFIRNLRADGPLEFAHHLGTQQVPIESQSAFDVRCGDRRMVNSANHVSGSSESILDIICRSVRVRSTR